MIFEIFYSFKSLLSITIQQTDFYRNIDCEEMIFFI